MVVVDDKLVQKLEQLSKLELSEVERQKLQNDLSGMIDMFSKIAEVDTKGVEPLTHMTDAKNRFRPDAVNQWQDSQALINLAPDSEGDVILVPKVIS